MIEPASLLGYSLVYCVWADHLGAVWFGRYGHSLVRLQDQVATPFSLDDGPLPSATPRVLFEDRSGTLWIGSDQGLHRYQAGLFTQFTRQHGLSHNDVRALAEDRAGTLYVGTGGGLDCKRGDRFTRSAEGQDLARKHITALYVDQEDTLWIGTASGGLGRLKDDRFAWLTQRDGLPCNSIGGVLEDDLANLWLSSSRGILRIPHQELKEYLAGKRRALGWQLYNRSDGLSTIECGGAGQPSCWKARDGRLWFATVKGAAVVDPKRLPFNPLPPPVVIEEVVLDEESIAGASGFGSAVSAAGRSASQVTVQPLTHHVEFRFTGLSLVAPEKVRFRYRLEGFDSEWVEAGTRRAAYYTSVPPGRYQFRVAACNNDGVWNDTGASLGLLVLPPWWQTSWFRALVGITLSGLVFWWGEHRVLRLRRERAARMAFSQRLIESQEEERKRIAAEMHDSLGQDLLVIKNRALLGLKDPALTPHALEQMEEISRMASHTLEEVREISRNLRPYQIDRLGLTKALQAMAATVSRASGLPCVAEFDSLDRLLAAPREIHLYRIVQELLNNVVKHSHASQCRVSARRQKDRLVLTVEDDGRGFDAGAALARPPGSLGLGLGVIAERVSFLGGTWQCDSRPGHGTAWRIEIPQGG